MNQRKEYFDTNPNYKATAIPAKGFCPVDNAYPTEWGWCKVHFRWECSKHSVSTHGVIIGDV